MKNNILYIIGVAFALVLMVFFSGFFRNVDFFPSKSLANNYKDAYIQGLNDPVFFEGIKGNFKNLYSESNFIPTDEMLSNSANCFKKQIFDNVINVKNKEKQKFLATETEIYNEDDYRKVIEIVTNKFKQDIQNAVYHCKDKHIEKKEVTNLRCEVSGFWTILPDDGADENGSINLQISKDIRNNIYTVMLSGIVRKYFESCEIVDFYALDDERKLQCESFDITLPDGSVAELPSTFGIDRDTGYMTVRLHDQLAAEIITGKKSIKVDIYSGNCSPYDNKKIF